MQTALPAILALTYPGQKLLPGESSSLSSFFSDRNRWNVLVPVTTMFLSGLANMAFIRPVTAKCKEERNCQGRSKTSANDNDMC